MYHLFMFLVSFQGLLSVSGIHIRAVGWTIKVMTMVLSLIFLLVKMDFILVNVSLDKTILFFASLSRLAV